MILLAYTMPIPIPDLPAEFGACKSINCRVDSRQTESVTLLKL